MKIYLQYPWKFPDSPYYKYLIDNPPKGVEYLNAKNQKGVITNKNKFLFSNKLKRFIRGTLKKLNLSIPNAHKSPDEDYDIIHCAHCLSKNRNKPWVADFEGVWQMFVGKKDRGKVEKILKENDCKKIMAWTEHTKNRIVKEFPEIKDKIEIVYPAVPSKNLKRKRAGGKINLIFSGRYFYSKGGFHALGAIDRLTREHENVYGIFNSEVPKEILRKYSKNKKIKFYGLIPQEKLFELYEKSNILIYPGYSDSFGFAYLEAMSFGIPVITVNGFARKEIVEEGKTGFVIEKPDNLNIKDINGVLVNNLIEKSSKLIKNKNLREKMSKNCFRKIKSGKFSIKERNKKLKRIYREALINRNSHH